MTEFHSATITANGVQIHYTSTPPRPGTPPLVFLHGITDSGLCASSLAEAMSGHRQVFLMDARGHGLSEKLPTGYGALEMAADLAGFVGALGLRKPILSGHSMGATVSALAESQYRLASALILEDPPWWSGDPPPLPEELALMAQAWHADIQAKRVLSPQAILTAQLKLDSRLQSWDKADLAAWALSKTQVVPEVAEFIAHQKPPYNQIVPLLQCPTLLVTGDQTAGSIVSRQVAADAAQLNPLLQVAHIPGAGHSIRRDRQEAFLEAVESFLAAVLPQSG